MVILIFRWRNRNSSQEFAYTFAISIESAEELHCLIAIMGEMQTTQPELSFPGPGRPSLSREVFRGFRSLGKRRNSQISPRSIGGTTRFLVGKMKNIWHQAMRNRR